MFIQTTAAVVAGCAIVAFAAPALFFRTERYKLKPVRRLARILGVASAALTFGFFLGATAGGSGLGDLPPFATVLLFVALLLGMICAAAELFVSLYQDNDT